MKAFFTLMVLLFSSTLVLTQVTLAFIDARTNEPFRNIEVIRQNMNSELLETQRTNEEGKATFSDTKGYIVIPEKIEGYKHFPVELFKEDHNKKLIYYVYPTEFLATSPRYTSQYGKAEKNNEVHEAGTSIPIEKEDKSTKDDTSESAQDSNEKNNIIELPEVEAEFVGGAAEMRNYLARSIVYPRHSLMLGEQGRVFVEFVVEKDGSISQIRILRGVSEAIDFETIRVIHHMPNWIPALYKGEVVRARCRIPISFLLK